MSSFVGLSHRIYLAHLDLSGLASAVMSPMSRVMQPCTTFNDGGYDCVKPGMISGNADVKGYQDFAVDVFEDDISVGQIGSQYAFSVIPNPTGTVAPADTCWFSRGVLSNLNPMDGAKGDMAGFDFGVAYDTAILQGKVSAPKATVSATTTGTAVALGGPTAAQRLYSFVHVFAFSGFTNVIFTVESDDAVGFPSATTRLTHTTVTAVGSEFASVAGGFNTETHHRIVATKTGTGSITYAAGFGVI